MHMPRYSPKLDNASQCCIQQMQALFVENCWSLADFAFKKARMRPHQLIAPALV